MQMISLDWDLVMMGAWTFGLGTIGAAVAGLFLANTDIFLTKPEKVTVNYLGETDLQTITKEQRVFKARELWEKNGAIIMAVRRPG